MPTGKAAQLEALIARTQRRPVVVLLGGHPDPDAIGSALAHRRIFEAAGFPVALAHVLPVARPENRALVDLLQIDLVRVSEPADLAAYRYLSLVDTPHPDPTLAVPETLDLLSVVDHHNPAQPPEAPFVDLRPDLGATCTIYAEYLEAGLSPLHLDTVADRELATALLFGIQTDTDDFATATADDFRAAAYLKPFSDITLLRRFGHRSMDPRAMDALGHALQNLEVVGAFALASVGRVPVENRDAIPIAADFILHREQVDTVLVFGLVGGRVDGSLRTTRLDLDPARFLDEAFGRDASGRPYGGGRTDKGGFQIQLDNAENIDDAELYARVEQLVRSRLRNVVPSVPPDPP